MKLHGWKQCAATLGVISLAAATNASVIVNDLGDAYSGTTLNSATLRAEGFSTSPDSGAISQITLGLSFTGSATSGNVYRYSADGSGQPLTSLGQIGAVSSTLNHLAGDQYSVTLNSAFAAANPLSSSGNYAIVIDSTGTTGVKWDYAATGGANTGAGGQLRYLDVEVVPEPVTQAGLIFGSLVALVAFARWLRNHFMSRDLSARL